MFGGLTFGCSIALYGLNLFSKIWFYLQDYTLSQDIINLLAQLFYICYFNWYVLFPKMSFARNECAEN